MTNPRNRPSFRTGQATVVTPGTPVQLPNLSLSGGVSVVMKAKSSNTGIITVGYSSASALNTGTDHFKLGANESMELVVSNLNIIWIDVTGIAAGQGVEWVVEL